MSHLDTGLSARAILLPRKGALLLIGLYQRLLSPLLAPRCRFYPSCSAYARDAVTHYGLVWGLLRTVWRLLRCHPFHPGGYDPVLPERRGKDHGHKHTHKEGCA